MTGRVYSLPLISDRCYIASLQRGHSVITKSVHIGPNRSYLLSKSTPFYTVHISSVYTVASDNNFDTLPYRMDVQVDRTTFTVTEDDINKKLIQLKIDKSPGPDLIHPRVLHENLNVIVRPLFLIIRRFLEFGILPTDWKLAEVTAVHKKGLKADSGNHRPISLTSVCCKILQSLVRDYIMKHLLDNNLLSNKQYGFVKGRSTMLQLLHMTDDWTLCLEKGVQIDSINSDFEKAFNKVHHERLISKLHSL